MKLALERVEKLGIRAMFVIERIGIPVPGPDPEIYKEEALH